MWALVGGSMTMLLASSCGDDGAAVVATDDPEDLATEDEAGLCLEAEAISDAVGVDVSLDSVTFGGTGTADVQATIDPTGVDVASQDGYMVSWQGCDYRADDGAAYMVGELVGEDGNSDVSGFDQLVELATAEPAQPGQPDVGDDAVYGRDDLAVRSGDRTIVLGFSPGSNPDADDMAILVDMAGAIIDGGHTDIQSMCQTAVDMAPEAWDTVGTPLLGGGGERVMLEDATGSTEEVDISYESCSVSLLDGAADLDVKLGDARLYAARAASSERRQPEIPELVDGVGDAAVWMSDRFYVRVGDRALTASGFTADNQPTDRDAIEALGASAAAALG